MVHFRILLGLLACVGQILRVRSWARSEFLAKLLLNFNPAHKFARPPPITVSRRKTLRPTMERGTLENEANNSVWNPSAMDNIQSDDFSEDLSEEERRQFPFGIPVKREFIGDVGVVTNENDHHEWCNLVRKCGGIMVGVGAEQNYLIAGWAQPQALVLMDVSTIVPQIHQIYGEAFMLASRPDDFLAFWDSGSDLLEGAIRKHMKSDELRRRVVEVGNRLRFHREKYLDMNIPSFLTDQQQYEVVADLWRNGRVKVLQGDLAGKRTMFDISNFSKMCELPVRVFYMSNALEWIRRGVHIQSERERLLQNFLRLPVDSSSFFLKTMYSPQILATNSWKYFAVGKDEVVKELASMTSAGQPSSSRLDQQRLSELREKLAAKMASRDELA